MHTQLIIHNARAGRVEEFAEVLSKFDSGTTQRLELTSELDLKLSIADARRQGTELVIAAGGDGTVNAVVNAMMHLPAGERPKLAILPMGTANDFAGLLDIPEAADEFVQMLNSSQCLPVDVVRIRSNGLEHYFANVAAGGNSVRVTEELTDEMKAQWGAFCYLRGSLQVLGDLHTYRLTIDLGQERLTDIGTWAVIVANGRTNAGRIVVAPDASPIDGLLDVILIRDGTVLDLVEIASNALWGSYLDCDQVVYRQVASVRLHSVPGMRFTMDGEIIDQEPVEFEVMPQAISMFVGSRFLMEHVSLQGAKAESAADRFTK
jgi:diacylglycerol kinase (ATP)